MKSIPLPLEKGNTLRVEVPAASLSIFPTQPGEAARFETKKPEHWHAEKKDNDVLLETASLPIWQLGDQTCRLYLPYDIPLQVKMRAGQIHAEHLRAPAIDLDTDSGEIKLFGAQGRIRLRTAMGAINARDIAGAVEAQADMGEIKLSILELAPGDHYVRANMGAIRVWLAPSLNVRVETETPMGSSRVRYPCRLDAPATLHLRADIGAIRVRENDSAPPEPHDWFDPEAWIEWAAMKFSPPRAAPRPFPPFFGSPVARPPFGFQAPEKAPPIDETELRKILDMVKEKKISVDEAEQLISALT